MNAAMSMLFYFEDCILDEEETKFRCSEMKEVGARHVLLDILSSILRRVVMNQLIQSIDEMACQRAFGTVGRDMIKPWFVSPSHKRMFVWANPPASRDMY